jgi:hypothetical protein
MSALCLLLPHSICVKGSSGATEEKEGVEEGEKTRKES